MHTGQDLIKRSMLPRRIMLLLTARTYRAQAFIEAANKLGVEIVKAIDIPKQLAEYWHYPLGIEYSDPEQSVRAIVEFAEINPLGAILPVDDSGTIIAALASQALGLPHNSPEAAIAARDKFIMRQKLSAHDVTAPKADRYFFRPPLDQQQLRQISTKLKYPSVLKPLNLNGSRGVIRVNDSQEFDAAAPQLYRLLHSHYPGQDELPFIVEDYVPGIEVALEGILDHGKLQVLALFDKPDPLDGPYFEETLYITPSKLNEGLQSKIAKSTAEAAAALGLHEGSVHAELRINQDGIWIIELAGRSIGGLCARTLKFGIEESLESIIIRQALGIEITRLPPNHEASGVMMIPIPEAGLLKGVHGCEEAASIPLIESIEITAKINNLLLPLPEGDSYLGFIFARGKSPQAVERALRKAHSKLVFDIAPQLPMSMPDM